MSRPESLDARREAFLRNIRDRVIATITPALQPDARPDDMSQAIKAVHSLTDENIGMIEQNAEKRRKLGTPLPRVACKKGCDYCCTIRVKVAVPEVFAVSEYIEANWSTDQKRELLERIEAYQKQFEVLTPVQRLNKMVPCPLLEDHSCSVHSVRSISARKHHSMDVQACIEGQKHPDKVKLPHYLEVDTVVAPIIAGLQTAMKERGLKSPMVTLIPALEISLKHPDAKKRWLAGEDVFANAVDKGIDELAFVRMKKLPTYRV